MPALLGKHNILGVFGADFWAQRLGNA